MDDEVIGCGGTLARHIAAGSDVTVIFLTDGCRGGVVMTEEGRPADRSVIVGVRKAEARRAAQILGVRTLIFLDAEDTRLDADVLVAGRLREVLERERPDIVYLPFFLERHADHRAANTVLLAATRGSALRFECRGYEVWTPLMANVLVNIDETIHLKRQALGCYQSQLAEMDYLDAAIGLNRFRALGLGRSGQFAEAFHALDLADYRRLYGALGSLA
jgi:LmbE family N-acetylglucosaminyl deacetylase